MSALFFVGRLVVQRHEPFLHFRQVAQIFVSKILNIC